MKTEMSEGGVITIRPESAVEAYALRQWVSKAAAEGRQWSNIEIEIDSTWPQRPAPPILWAHRSCLVCGGYHASKDLPCPNSPLTSGD